MFLVLASVHVFAQQETYTRIFSGTSYDEGIAAFRLPNKEIRLIGNTGSFGHGNTDVWYIALDSNGNFLWHKFFGGTKIEKVEAAVMNSQGAIFMVGSTTQNTQASYQVYFLGIDQYGQIIGYNNYGGANWDFGHGICLINDTTFALVGETYSYGLGQNDVYLLKVNQQGDTLWTRTYGANQEENGNAVELMPDNGFILVGSSRSYGNGSMDSYMIRTDNLGDTLWTKVVKHITDAEFMDVAVNPDTSMVFCGYRKDTFDTYRDNNLEKYDKNASFVWSRFNSLSEGKDCYAKNMIRESNGRYTFCGITTKFAHSKYADARIIRTTNSGWWQESASMGDLDKDEGNAILLDQFHGKHYFLTGTTKSYGLNRSSLFFVRLDSNLDADTTRIIFLPTSLAVSSHEDVLKCYPNPVTNTLNIEIPSSKQAVLIQVFNLHGKQVFTKEAQIRYSSYALSTQNLKKGMYFITITTKKSILKGKFIKL